MQAYLDHNATSVIDPEILEDLIKAYRDLEGNPSSTHALGRKAKAQYLKAKDAFAKFFQCSSQEIFFVSSATSGLNWLLLNRNYKHIISSDLEHAAIFNTLKVLEERGTKITWIHPGAKGYVNSDDLKSAIMPETDLIILGAANSETGIIQDTKPLSLIAKSFQIPFYVDAVGLCGKSPFELDPNVTAYVISSHKIHGPKGIACVIHKSPKSLNPKSYGGYQEGSKIAGTENLQSALAFSSAFIKIQKDLSVFEDLKNKRDFFEKTLKEQLDVEIIGFDGPRVMNTSCIRFKGISGETLLQLLDQYKIYASHGSACSSGALEPSRVLVNMDMGFKQAKEGLRFSISKFTSFEELQYASQIICQLVKELSCLETKTVQS